MLVRWLCGRCFYQEDTRPRALAPMHSCPGMGGLAVPLTAEGDRVGHIVNERDCAEAPVMSVTTQHLDGREDCTVYPLPLQVGTQPGGIG